MSLSPALRTNPDTSHIFSPLYEEPVPSAGGNGSYLFSVINLSAVSPSPGVRESTTTG